MMKDKLTKQPWKADKKRFSKYLKFKDAVTEREISFEELVGYGDGDTGILGEYGDK